jgi:hypothetical protein
MKHRYAATISVCILLVVLSLVIMIILAGCTVVSGPTAQLPPQDFQLMAVVDLSTRVYDEEILGEFTLDKTAVVGIRYTLPNVDITYFDLSLIGPQEEKRVILHSENYRTDAHGGGEWEKNLMPGTYRLALIADGGHGILSVYKANP